ncbi:hypothetical protein AAJP47_05135 [Psychrobacter sp. B38]|uniref:hypothetical protein n=1 Tax=Psychrobacter sp. B38 TaxID=3143538 RepID=UPI0032106D3A
MTIPKLFSFKSVISGGLVAALLATTVGCTAVSSGYDNQPVYRGSNSNGHSNVNYNKASQQLRKDLRRQGYQVMDIKSNNYRGQRALTAHARKNNQNYELIYAYPSLRFIGSNRTAWSNNGHDNKYKDNRSHNNKYKNNGNYKNKGKHRNNQHPNRYER